MSTITWYVPIAAAHLVSGFLAGLAIVGLVWVVVLRTRRPGTLLPWKAVWLVAALVAFNGIVRDVPQIRDRVSGEASFPEIQRVNEVFVALLGEGISRAEASASLAGLDPGDWSDDAFAVVFPAVSVKSERYVDIHQSFMAGRVIRTPIPHSGWLAAELSERDRAAWDPLLEAAARGGPVQLPDAVIESADESFWLALLAARARVVLLQELEKLYGIDMPLSSADRALSHALDWVGVATVAFSRDEDVSKWIAFMQTVGDASAGLDESTGTVSEGMQDAWESAPAFVSSLLTYNWAVEILDLAMSEWLAATALGLTPSVSLEAVDAHRRLLGMPTGLTQIELEYVQATGTLPEHVALGRARVDESLLLAIDVARHQLAERFARIAPGWLPPALRLR